MKIEEAEKIIKSNLYFLRIRQVLIQLPCPLYIFETIHLLNHKGIKCLIKNYSKIRENSRVNGFLG